MTVRTVVAGLAVILVVAYGLVSQATAEQPGAADDKPTDQGVALDTSMHDFMEGVFQGPYRRLKAAMATETKSNATWKSIRGETLILAEGGNLLLLRKPKKDVEAWIKYSVASRDAGAEMLKAAKKKDAAATMKAYRAMLTHCNACHKQFDNGKNQLEP